MRKAFGSISIAIPLLLVLSGGSHAKDTLEKARHLYSDETFRVKMQSLFQGEPTGRIYLMPLQDAFERIAEIERRVEELDKLVGKK